MRFFHFAALFLSGLLIQCQSQSSSLRTPSDLESLLEKGELHFATRDFATSVYHDREGRLTGLEYDLIQSFSSFLGVKPKIHIKENIADVFTSLRAGEAQIAAASLTQTDDRKEEFVVPRPYEEVTEEVVCHSQISIDKPAELALFQIQVEKDSSYIESLRSLKEEHPQINWEEKDLSSEEILAQIDDRKTECSIIDSNLFNIFRRYFPSAKKQFSLPGTQDIGWLVNPSADYLEDEIDTWIDRITVSGELKRLLDKHYGFSDRFDPYDLQKFRERIDTRLKPYVDWFKEAAEEYDFDWKLLAAVSYQESHWDPQAVSPTGVKGMMMLTQATAEEMGVEDRTDAKQSILGGGKYLRSRMQRVPTYVSDSERVWFALAAYNVGFGHLRDARAVAVQLDLNPNRWLDVRTALPKLSNSQYNRFGRFGYARGIEPVLYVKRIRDYYDILERELEN